MNEYDNLEKVKKLFSDKGIKSSDDNIYLAMLKDYRKYSGMVAGMEYPYSGLLLCISNEGVGYFYLNQPKFSLRVFLDKLVVDQDSYTFIDNDNIKKIEVKKFALLDKKRKQLLIQTTDNKKHYLGGPIVDDLIEYNTENMSKLIDKYEKK